jgi:2,4-dienoyl-CoA reductase-like NADH-dependent reductase (Old Yellow Enzyme family)
MKELFESTFINGMGLKNRFIRSGTATGMATQDGLITPKLTDLIVNVARGGAALIIPDYAPVLKSGITHNQQLGMYSDEHIAGLANMVNAIHVVGSKVVIQIVHGGTHADPRFTGVESMGPSAIPAAAGKFGPFPGCREMTIHDIDSVVEGYRIAAIRAKKAGFDGIQLHCAHGYLFSQFLSPFYNKRTDDYGGDITNRTRIIVETYKQVRNEVGPDYPILVKMNVTDFIDGGITVDDAIQTTGIFAAIGIDAIELSGGTGWGLQVLGDLDRTPMRMVKDEGYYRDVAKSMKSVVSIPVILTGGIRSYHIAAQFVRDGVADYIGLCRPLIREPGLINRWKSGDTSASRCISDNGCLMAGLAQGKDLQCVRLTQKQTY